MKKSSVITADKQGLQEKPAFLTGKRIYLRPLEMTDLQTFYYWFNNPELRQYVQMPYPVSIEQEREFIDNAMKNTDPIVLAIVLKHADRLIGDIFMSPIDRVHRKASLGIAIGDTNSQSMGYGIEAMQLLIDYAFNTLNLHRLELSVYSFNVRAIKCYRKLGFKEEGRSREAFFGHGQYHDILQMGLLEGEWWRIKSR
jgi:RimJ/RimL family protein N-acetyltransferase